jgi:hypothetical protein
MQRTRIANGIARLAAAGVLVATSASAAFATVYPVSGKWTYENATATGPARDCRIGRSMEFLGEQRFDSGTSVPQYRNFTIARFDAWLYRVVDEFDNAMIRGYVSYTLRIVDADHIELNLDASGRTFLLRRCA